MMRSVTATLTALVVFSAVVLSVHAGPISGTFNGNSTLTPIGVPGVFVQNFTGDGSDATYGAFILSSTSTIDFSAPPDIVFSDGSFLDIFPGAPCSAPAPAAGAPAEWEPRVSRSTL